MTIRANEPWKQTMSGRAVPLMRLGPDHVDLHGDIAESLARLCRYDGHVPGGLYSVAQHCVLMADAALEETGDATLAAHCLVHDAHEAYIGDIATPVVAWMDAVAAETENMARPSGIIAAMKSMADRAIWAAAGLPAPGQTWRDAIRDYDLRMLATEKRQLLMPCATSWGATIETARPIRMRGRITLWSIARAADEWRARLDMLCPNARRVA